MKIDPATVDTSMDETDSSLPVGDRSTWPLYVHEILGQESDKWLSAVRSLKHRVIGSRRQKQAVLDYDIVPVYAFDE